MQIFTIMQKNKLQKVKRQRRERNICNLWSVLHSVQMLTKRFLYKHPVEKCFLSFFYRFMSNEKPYFVPSVFISVPRLWRPDWKWLLIVEDTIKLFVLYRTFLWH